MSQSGVMSRIWFESCPGSRHTLMLITVLFINVFEPVNYLLFDVSEDSPPILSAILNNSVYQPWGSVICKNLPINKSMYQIILEPHGR